MKQILVMSSENTKSKTIVGVDYSMNGPAFAVISDDYVHIKYWTNKKKYGEVSIETDDFSIEGILIDDDYESNEERFEKLASEIVSEIAWYWPSKVYLEDYSYASTGRAFSIGENVGILKNKLYSNGIKFEVVAPTQVKKFATGKGNGNKELMQEAFEKEFAVDIKSLLMQNTNHWNPSSDIIDAYYIATYGKLIEEDTL